MELYAVIMAGGVGSRFWPRSREKMPKQLLKIFGEHTMIQDTVRRISKIVKPENIYIVTNKVQKTEIHNQLNQIPQNNIIVEPFGRNTAACIGLASVLIDNFNKDAVTLILPADHIIRDEDAFLDIMKKAAKFAYKKNGLVTIGIQPTRPETGYGYIQREDQEIEENIFKVKTFAEKPNYQTAEKFLESGDFVWNSGMFIWKVESILKEIGKHMPDLMDGLNKIQKSVVKGDYEKTLETVYRMLRSISIDYGIMEKSDNVFVIRSTFGWSDVGSWEEVYQLSHRDEFGNSLHGNFFIEGVHNSLIHSESKFTACIGIENLIVINTDDALLVANRNNSQDVKKVVDYLKKKKINDFL
ncbi:MAG: mannose-1-phosphate guanylyltransferase [Ignavibacteria bacterium]|nr:mannose-1-phosphate guanylyltransferase [Ignavibacteria bacterium]